MKYQEQDPRIIYADIIDLPHHQSDRHPHMSLYDRAAQFSPFAALVGYDDMIAEEARETEVQMAQNIQSLNYKLSIISGILEDGGHPELSFTVFIPDERKSGGAYDIIRGTVKRIDTLSQTVILYSRDKKTDGETIPIGNIHDIHGEIF